MKKIHARLSVEIVVSDEEFERIVNDAGGRDFCDDIDDFFYLYPDMIQRAKPCDWDDFGYVPGQWLQDDIDEQDLFTDDEEEE